MDLRMMLVFLFALISKDTLSVNMCEKGTTEIDDDNLELVAIGPSISPLTTNISTTCSCVINTTYSSNKVSFRLSRKTDAKGNSCKKNKYDEATLVLKSGTDIQPLTLQNEELSNYKEEHEDLSAIELSITINSICGSSYTIRLTEKSRSKYRPRISHVTCVNPKTVITSCSTTASPTVLTLTEVSKTDTGRAKESSSAGLIVGVVVGVGGGLLLLGAIILAVIIFRRRRAKPQPLTYTNRIAPTENSSEPAVSYETLDTYTQIQTGILYDNHIPATDPLSDETNQNYYSVVQGIDNSAFHPFDAVPSNDHPSSSGEVKNFVQEPNSIDDMDTTVIENDLYE